MQKTNIKLSPVNLEERKNLKIKAGDTVKVWSKIQEKGKTRLQAFEGLVLARKHGAESGGTITVRKVSSGVGVERIFPLYSPSIDKIELLRSSKVRRSKLYFIRDKAAKEVRKKIKAFTITNKGPKDEIEEEINGDQDLIENNEEIIKEVDEGVKEEKE